MRAKQVVTKAKQIWMKNRLILCCALALTLIIPALLMAAGGQPPSQQQEIWTLIDDGLIAQGVNIGSHDVSGLDADGALVLIHTKTVQQPEDPDEAEQGDDQQESGADTDQEDAQNAEDDDANQPEPAMLVLVLPDRKINIPMSELPVTPQAGKAVSRAMRIGRDGGISSRLQQIEDAKNDGTIVYMPYGYQLDALREAILDIAAKIPRASVQGLFVFDPSLEARFVITSSILGFEPDDEALVACVEDALQSGEIHHVEIPGTVSGDPVDEKATQSVMENITLVSTFTTKVAGSSSRVHNVKTAANIINGTIVQPGAVFSTNETLGPRTSAAGIWKKAPAISSGRLVDELGGGICQISSTLLNAVARADLEIVEWWHHSIPSSYVPIGCDATISTGGKDFQFKNNTEFPIYIVFDYNSSNRKLTCEVWGRPLPDGQYIEIVGRQTGTRAMPAAVTTTDPERVYSGKIGKYSRTYKVRYAADGTEITREMIDKTTYPARAPVVLATPTPDPSGGVTPTPDGGATPTPDGGTASTPPAATPTPSGGTATPAP